MKLRKTALEVSLFMTGTLSRCTLGPWHGFSGGRTQGVTQRGHSLNAVCCLKTRKVQNGLVLFFFLLRPSLCKESFNILTLLLESDSCSKIICKMFVLLFAHQMYFPFVFLKKEYFLLELSKKKIILGDPSDPNIHTLCFPAQCWDTRLL